VLRYVARRLLQIPVTLMFVSVMVFSLVHLIPGDPVHAILGDFATPEAEAALRRNLGLDKPLVYQYVDWMRDVVRGDFGTSLFTGRSVRTMMMERAPYTLTLAIFSTCLAVLIAIPLGALAATFQNRFIDQVAMVVSMFGMALPNFLVAILLILLFAIYAGLVPIAGAGDPFGDPVGSVKYYILPVVALASTPIAHFTRIMRSSMLDVLGQDYIRVARAKGARELHVVINHAFKNSMIPLITVTAIAFANALGGTVIIESIFSIPGLGSLMLHSVVSRDFPLIQGTILVLAAIFIFVNLIADLLYGLMDPRIRFE
jgi:peptide/nickel transport system permease protein